jgi:hypothetical protein
VFSPVQIWAYDRGTFRDVTRRFPRVISRDTAELWRYHLKYRRTRIDRYVLAAWVADESMLGRSRSADRVLARAVHSRSDLAHHQAFLRRNGYR